MKYVLKQPNWLLLLSFSCTVCCQTVAAQTKQTDTTQYRTVVAGPEYKRSSFHQWLWGHHYRKDWATPVVVPVIHLNEISGGLTPYEAGGGRQSKSLRLHDAQNREYVLRSIDKSFGGALPELYQHTFIESIVNDQVSIAEPYSALTIAPMAEKAGIYHTNPIIGFLPQQPALDTFNANFGNTLFLLEQRPDENWETAPNFGNAKKIIGTDKLLEKLQDDNDVVVDQLAFVRARLFDMLIGDWGRHEDQWRWAEFKNGDKTLYQPIPRDRDQAYTKFDGFLLNIALKAAGLKNLQTFDKTIKNVDFFNLPARNLDRRLTNEVTLQQWESIAREMQAAVTNDVIEDAIKKLPPEVYALSGRFITETLKARRDNLLTFATDYYHFLAKEVEVVGTTGKEYFYVNRLNDTETSVAIYNITKEGETEKKPYYQRVFNTAQTKEVRIYGIDDNDVYKAEGKASKGVVVRLIGGDNKDSFTDESSVGGRRSLYVYDDKDNTFHTSGHTKLRLSSDTSIHTYKYDAFEYDKKGIRPAFFYSNNDRFYLSLGYILQHHRWRVEPYKSQHALSVRYSISQNAFSVGYTGEVNHFIGNWSLALDGVYDAIRWTNFFGIGNDTKNETTDNNYYRMRTREGLASVGLNHTLGKYNKIGFSGFVRMVDIINDKDRYVSKTVVDPLLFDTHYFGGGRFNYWFQKVNDPVVPTSGFSFAGNIAYIKNLKQSDRHITSAGADARFYIPLFAKLVLAVRTGVATVDGQPEFYQLPSIGGSETLRGYRRERFYGKTAFYDSNELQWLWNLHSYLFNGKFGLVGVYDNGRVWQPGEDSNTWHYGYGGGILLAPFNKLMLSVTYVQSPETGSIYLRFTKAL